MILERDADEGVEPAIDIVFKVEVAVAVIKKEMRAIREDDFEALVSSEIDRHGSGIRKRTGCTRQRRRGLRGLQENR